MYCCLFHNLKAICQKISHSVKYFQTSIIDVQLSEEFDVFVNFLKPFNVLSRHLNMSIAKGIYIKSTRISQHYDYMYSKYHKKSKFTDSDTLMISHEGAVKIPVKSDTIRSQLNFTNR